MALATCRSVLRAPSRHIRAFVVCAAYSDKPSRLGHLLPKKNAQRKPAASSPPAECHENYPAPVSQDQLVLAAQLLAKNEQGYDSDEELSIISSLDIDDVLQEANKLRWELSCPDLDTLRQYGPLLVGRSDDSGYGSATETSSTPDA